MYCYYPLKYVNKMVKYLKKYIEFYFVDFNDLSISEIEDYYSEYK